MTSTTLPLPSSPHCMPTTTMLAMTTPRAGEEPGRRLQHVAHGERALVARDQIQGEQLTPARARTADHEHPPHTLSAGVVQRFLQPTADDVARHRGPQVAQAPGQRE